MERLKTIWMERVLKRRLMGLTEKSDFSMRKRTEKTVIEQNDERE